MSGGRSINKHFNLPSITTPVARKENNFRALINKKFFVSSVLDDIRIPQIDSRNGFNGNSSRFKGNNKVNQRLKNYKERVNCGSVKPIRECKYYSKRIKKNNTNQNVEMFMLENYSKTPVEEYENCSPSYCLKNNDPYDLKKFTIDTGVNTDLSLM